MQLAGRWLNQATLNPIASGLGVGAATAGAATLGNVLSGEAGREGGGRVTLEALGAGALGGIMGSQIPYARGLQRKWRKDVAQKVANQTGYTTDQGRVVNPGHKKFSTLGNDGTGKETTTRPSEYQKIVDDAKEMMDLQHKIGWGGTVIQGIGLGGLGGMIGGGVSNIGNMAGIGGLQQNTIVDPEAYGSSNLKVY
jgi:hypothetical protein